MTWTQGELAGTTQSMQVAALGTYTLTDLNGLQPAQRVSNIRVDVQPVAPTTFATSGTQVVPYNTTTTYGWVMFKRACGVNEPTINWAGGQEDPLCSQPDALMAWGLIPTNQEIVQIRVPYGRTLHMGDQIEMIFMNLEDIPSNVSGLPPQDQHLWVAVSYNYK